MTISKEEGERLDEEEDEEIERDGEAEIQMERQDAMTRQIYDTEERRFDDQKRKVTDLSEFAKNEALIEMRRGLNSNIYDKYREEACNKRGEVRENLSEQEKDGLRSLQKRMKEKEVVILKTDKSGKLCITSREE